MCPECNLNLIKNYYSKRCGECDIKRKKSLKGDKSPLWDGGRICKKCQKLMERRPKHGICWDCYSADNYKGRPKCLSCGNLMSRYNYTDSYCQKCYRGDRTKRWNPNLESEIRENGRTINPKYYEWRLNVFNRDRFQCQKCGDNKGGNLVAHHIFNFHSHKELRTDINNGITLCEKCHIVFHKIYGNKNNNKKQINEFLNICN
jgi:5-methylcytosine-specific restriction endonuclease McrA